MFENDHQHQHTHPGSPGCSYRRQRSRKNNNELISHRQVHAVNLGNKQGGYSLIKSRPVHVDSCAQGEHKTGNVVGHAKICFTDLNGYGKRCRAGTGAERDQLGGQNSL